MKQTSTQQSDEESKIGDELYRIYFAELKIRGIDYFNKISNVPSLVGGDVSPTIIEELLTRLAYNKGIVSQILSSDPKNNISTILLSDNPSYIRDLIIDFIDDVTLNVRLRNPDLFDRNKAILLDQINSIANNQTVMDAKASAVFKDAIKFYDSLLVTLHYLRKIGCSNVIK